MAHGKPGPTDGGAPHLAVDAQRRADCQQASEFTYADTQARAGTGTLLAKQDANGELWVAKLTPRPSHVAPSG